MANWPPFHRLGLSKPLKLILGITDPACIAGSVTIRHNRPPSIDSVSLASLATNIHNSTLVLLGMIFVLSSTLVLQYSCTIVYLCYSIFVLQCASTIVSLYYSTFVLQCNCIVVRLYYSIFVLQYACTIENDSHSY